ncbi:MAG: peroxiredoxin-like family protein [Candidatus Binatia bacterium]
MAGIKDELDQAGVALVAIGNGNTEQAKDFVSAFDFPGEVYVDPERRGFRAFRLNRGLISTLGPSAMLRGIRAFGAGFRQGAMAGDPWQQGGTFVIGPGPELLFAHRDAGAGDQPDVDGLLVACRR